MDSDAAAAGGGGGGGFGGGDEKRMAGTRVADSCGENSSE